MTSTFAVASGGTDHHYLFWGWVISMIVAALLVWFGLSLETHGPDEYREDQ